jgi:hypothetical protein
VIIQIPLTADPAQNFTTQLGAVKYYLEVKYNSRSGVWTLDLYDDATRAVIALGLPIVLGQDLLEPYNFGIGSLVAIDLNATSTDAGADDLGTRVALFWTSPDETFEE